MTATASADRRRPLVRLPRLEYVGRYAGSYSGPSEPHTFCELMLLERGRYRIETAGRTLEASSGSLFILPPGHAQQKKAFGIMRTVFLFIEAPASRLCDDCRVVDLRRETLLPRWFGDLFTLFQAQPRSDAVLSSLLLSILERLRQIEHGATQARRMHASLRLATAALQQELSRDWSAAELARVADISESYLAALFRMEIGVPPLQYLQRLRIEHAQTLLRNPYLSLKAIARACGYADLNYFLRVFRSNVGQPPGAWRKGQL